MIFFVEDDENIRELVIYALKAQNFIVKGFENKKELFNSIKIDKPKLILLDIMLKEDDGIDILKELKQDLFTMDIPVIMISAKSSEYDKVKCLDLGADDYITKPFGMMELISRIKALIRRSYKEDNKKVKIADMIIDIDKHSVEINDEKIDLTKKEFELLVYLVRNKGIVLSRNKILEKIWGYDYLGETRTVDVHIRTLRQKLGVYSKFINTVHGIGYKFLEE